MIDPVEGAILFGLSVVLARGRTVLLADTAVHELPTAEELADIAVQAAAMARQLGHEPRVALLSFSTFGNPPMRADGAGARGGAPARLPAGRFRI